LKVIYDKYIETTFDEELQASFKILQFERNYRPFFPGERLAPVLDIGIGRGEMLTCMKKWGCEHYLGIDISPSAVKHCETLGLTCLHVEDTVTWLAQSRAHWQVITLLDVLEHFPKSAIVDFLAAVHGALAQGGRLIVQVPNLQSPDGFLHRYNDLTHEVGFTEHSLRQVLTVAGFERVDFHGFEESFCSGIKERCRLLLRGLYRASVRFSRHVHGNLNPYLISPIMYAVATKQ